MRRIRRYYFFSRDEYLSPYCYCITARSVDNAIVSLALYLKCDILEVTEKYRVIRSDMVVRLNIGGAWLLLRDT